VTVTTRLATREMLESIHIWELCITWTI